MKINTISDNTSLFTNYHHVVLLIEGNSIILWEKNEANPFICRGGKKYPNQAYL